MISIEEIIFINCGKLPTTSTWCYGLVPTHVGKLTGKQKSTIDCVYRRWYHGITRPDGRINFAFWRSGVGRRNDETQPCPKHLYLYQKHTHTVSHTVYYHQKRNQGNNFIYDCRIIY